MTKSITLQIANSTNTFTIQTENKNLISSLVTINGDEISATDVTKLQEAAKRGGDLGILENCDLNGQEKVNLAKLNNFSEYYDIKLSDDGKYFQVTVKDAGFWVKNPTLGTIKADFGVKDNVFVQQGGIAHGNQAIIEKRAEAGSSADGRNTDYDAAKLEVGDTINIPVNEINIDGSPRGFWGRLFQ